MKSIYSEIDLKDTPDWGLQRFKELTENGHRSLLIRNAFDPQKSTDSILVPLDSKIKYTRMPVNFKTGVGYFSTKILKYLDLIHSDKTFYSSWGISSMNDKPKAMKAFQQGAQSFVSNCLAHDWNNILGHKLNSSTSLVGHFIAGNTNQFEVKADNHYVFTINHIFQIYGTKVWYLSDPAKAMNMPEFIQFNPMEFMLKMSSKDYIELPFVEKLTTRPGDYFYNAPLVGHSVAMGPGKNLMLSIRQSTKDYMVRPDLLPLLYRAINVTRTIIHSDVKQFWHWTEIMPDYDNELYGDGTPVSKYRLPSFIASILKRFLSAFFSFLLRF